MGSMLFLNSLRTNKYNDERVGNGEWMVADHLEHNPVSDWVPPTGVDVKLSLKEAL